MAYFITTEQGHHESPSSLAHGIEGRVPFVISKGLTLVGCAATLTISATSCQFPASAHHGLHSVPEFQCHGG